MVVWSPSQGVNAASRTWGKTTHPWFFRMNPDTFVVYYQIIGDKGGEAKGIAPADWPMYTDDRGRTWKHGNPMLWGDGLPPFSLSIKKDEPIVTHWGFGFVRTDFRDGISFGMTQETTGGAQERYGSGVWSKDGRIWFGPYRITSFTPFHCGGIWWLPSSVELDDGTLLAIAFARVRHEEVGPRPFTLLMFESRDQGRTFHYRSTIATPAQTAWSSDEGPNEADLVRLPDGELLVVARVGKYNVPLVEARSRDDGRTWTLQQMELRGVNPQFCQMRDGTLALVYGRPGTHIVFSRDGGRSWKNRVSLPPDGYFTTGYGDVEEVEPGRLLVIYDAQDYPWKDESGTRIKVNAIFSEILTVR